MEASTIRIVCVSDTHGYHQHLDMPDGDILIFAGDYTYDHQHKHEKQINRLNNWFGKQPHRHKLFVCGNHDKFFERDHLAKSHVTNATYLNDELVEVEGLKIWGSPITPRFLDWAFLRDRGADIRRHWNMIPDDIDILITHGPPYGILDLGDPKYREPNKDPHLGCVDLFDIISRLKKLKLHAFGHIHESYGRVKINGIEYVNCSKGYRPVNNPPIVVDLSI